MADPEPERLSNPNNNDNSYIEKEKVAFFSKPRIFFDIKDSGPFIIYIESKLGDPNIGRFSHLKIAREIGILNLEGIINIKNKGINRIAVEFNNYKKANDLLNNKEINDKYKVFIPSNIISCKGIIRQIDLELSEEHLLEKIKSDIKIINVKRLNRKSSMMGKLSSSQRYPYTFHQSFSVIIVYVTDTQPKHSAMAIQNLSFIDASQLFPRVLPDRSEEPNIIASNFPSLQQKTFNSIDKDNRVLPSQRRPNKESNLDADLVPNNTSPIEKTNPSPLCALKNFPPPDSEYNNSDTLFETNLNLFIENYLFSKEGLELKNRIFNKIINHIEYMDSDDKDNNDK
ncbi:hypothetical protein ABEB36_012992 [Hypothenemus hampei]|uniref:RRM domain-containing protein n=1 Tax=Hypothenemus hampei TaxID=57062 RepID=A0ABD1E6G3_HYPHA